MLVCSVFDLPWLCSSCLWGEPWRCDSQVTETLDIYSENNNDKRGMLSCRGRGVRACRAVPLHSSHIMLRQVTLPRAPHSAFIPIGRHTGLRRSFVCFWNFTFVNLFPCRVCLCVFTHANFAAVRTFLLVQKTHAHARAHTLLTAQVR